MGAGKFLVRKSLRKAAAIIVEALENRRLLDGVVLGNRDVFAAGDHPGQAVSGDFNGDGVRDIAVIDYDSANWLHDPMGYVQVLLGKAEGGFHDPRGYAVETSLEGLVAADFNHDGRDDLAVALGDYRTAGIAILYSQPDGILSGRRDFETNDWPGRMSSADFNKDGMTDLAVIGALNDKVMVLYGNADGGLGNERDIQVHDPGQVLAADVNGDGRADIITSDDLSDVVSVSLARHDIGFDPKRDYTVSYNTQTGIVAGDFSGDGVIDLVACHSNILSGRNGEISFLPGKGDGTFDTFQLFYAGDGPAGMSSGDFNGDGRLDIAVANWNDGTITLLYGQPGGGLAHTETYLVGDSPSKVVADDFNGDGRLDLAVTHGTNGIVSVLYNQNAKGDLLITQTSPSTDTAQIGEQVSIDLKVSNNGYGQAGASQITLYLSSDSAVNQSKTVLGTLPVPALNSWEQFTGRITFNAPAAGSYQLAAMVDSAQQIAESDETNNWDQQFPLTVGPDLMVTPGDINYAVAPGQVLDVPVAVRNAAGVDAATGFDVTLYASSAPSMTSDQVEVGRYHLASLEAGADCTASIRYTAPAVPGVHYLRAVVDWDNVVAEYNETNNRGPVMTVNIGCDLTATITSVPSATVGRAVDLPVEVDNFSAVATGKTFTVSIYLSTDATVTKADRLVGSFTCPALGAEQGATRHITFTAPAAGNYYLAAFADSGNLVSETNEANNWSTPVAMSSAPVYTLVTPGVLRVGNTWNYKFHISQFEGMPLNYDGVLKMNVDHTVKMAGLSGVAIYRTVPGPYQAYSSAWEYSLLTGGNVAMLGWSDYGGSNTVNTGKPLAHMPVLVSAGDQYQHVGSAKYTGKSGTRKWSGQADSYITYVGRQTVKTRAGTFSCTVIREDRTWTQTGGVHGSLSQTWWMEPNIGPVKSELSQTTSRGTTRYSFTLDSTNVKKK